jgi:hypothetical protein
MPRPKNVTAERLNKFILSRARHSLTTLFHPGSPLNVFCLMNVCPPEDVFTIA